MDVQSHSMTERIPGTHRKKDIPTFNKKEYRAAFEAKLGWCAEKDRTLILKAYDYGEKAHGKQQRDEGSPYIVHTVDSAGYYIEAGGREVDIVCIILLHDVKEDTSKDVKAKDFNPRIAEGVDVLTKPKREDVFPHKKKEVRRVAYQRLEVSSWWGFVVAKLSERLHNVRTLSPLKASRQQDTIMATRESLMRIFKSAINVSSEPEVVRSLIQQLKDALDHAEKDLREKGKWDENRHLDK